GRRILLVDDSAETLQAIAMVLHEAGAEVTATDNAQAALESFAVQSPDLLVSDIGMPTTDGYELIRRVRELEEKEERPTVPALALTAFARSTDRQQALESGFQEHLAKPVEAEV